MGGCAVAVTGSDVSRSSWPFATRDSFLNSESVMGGDSDSVHGFAALTSGPAAPTTCLLLYYYHLSPCIPRREIALNIPRLGTLLRARLGRERFSQPYTPDLQT